VAMCGRPDVSRRQTFQILRDEVYSCKEIDGENANRHDNGCLRHFFLMTRGSFGTSLEEKGREIR
jgi:hypothetical protein